VTGEDPDEAPRWRAVVEPGFSGLGFSGLGFSGLGFSGITKVANIIRT
jgi:hypothetical protein